MSTVREAIDLHGLGEAHGNMRRQARQKRLQDLSLLGG